MLPPAVSGALALIGNTPLVRVSCFDTAGSELWLKLESHNPGGSIKDRIGLSMIAAAEAEGRLAPGGHLIEATAGNRAGLIGESADVLYHLIVMWVNADIRPDEVWAELRRREGISGIAEKASRARALPLALGIETTKIP